MSKYARPRLPARTEHAISALGGNAARVAIIGALVAQPASTPGELATYTGLSVNTIRKHLGQLLVEGVVESDPPASLPFTERNGQRARYSVIARALESAYAELGAALGLRRASD